MILLAILLIGTAAALGYGWYKTNEDKKDLEQATNQQGQELSAASWTRRTRTWPSTQQELTAANAKVTDLQNQLSAAQKEADTAKAESAALAALFPMNAQKLQPAMPGTYRTDAANAATGGCSLGAVPAGAADADDRRPPGAA